MTSANKRRYGLRSGLRHRSRYRARMGRGWVDAVADPDEGVADVDLLSIGLPDGAVLGRRLSARYADRCRGVEVAAAAVADGRQQEMPAARRAARKTLLAVAGLVSVHHAWTTDRSRAVRRWSELEPGLATQLGRLHSLTWRSPHERTGSSVLATPGQQPTAALRPIRRDLRARPHCRAPRTPGGIVRSANCDQACCPS